MSDATESSGSILFDFADQLLTDVDAGRLRPLAHYLERFPGHEEKVAREYLALTGTFTGADTSGTKRDRRSQRIGPYEIVGVLGRGGQGVVYRALDRRLDRSVALKVLTIPVASVSQGRRARFRREAEILARLDHPGICAVLDADLDGESPYIAMRYIEGETLAAALVRAREERDRGETPASPSDSATSASRLLAPRRPLELAETLSFFERTARALHAAHEAGVVHRDVKPGNLMVSAEGAPVILDFGLAQDDAEASAQLTRSDEVFGTPAYISPEQLESGRHVDRATDVYSLGVVLYEVLTLTRPFQADSNAALAEAIRSAPLPPPRKWNPNLPADLAVVLETALERDVARRYPTALDFAEELRRVREYEPILARPAGPLLRLRRFGQRNPVMATGIVGSIVALSVALSIALVLLDRVRDEKQRKESALALFEGGWFRDEASSSLPYSPPFALDYAIAAAGRDPGLASNRVLLAALEALHERAVLIGHTKVVYDVDIDSTSRRIATASLDGTVRIWDAVSGRGEATFDMGGAVHTVAITPDGSRIAYGGADGRAFVRSLVDASEPAVELEGHARDVYDIEFSADGARVLTASRDTTARVFDAATGRELVVCAGHTGSIAEARFARSDAWVVTRSSEPKGGSMVAESDATKRIFDARTGRELWRLGGSPTAATALAVSSDGRWLAVGCEDATAQLWDLAAAHASARADGESVPTLAPLHEFSVSGRMHAVRFSPDGRSLALSWDSGAKVVDVSSGADRYVLPDHGHRAVAKIEFRPDGREIATAAYDDTLRVFDAESGALLRMCRGSARQIQGLAWSPDGSFLTTWQRQFSVSVWYGEQRPFLPVLRGHSGRVRTARFTADGRHVFTSSDDGTARAWSVPTGAPELVFDAGAAESRSEPLLGVAFDANVRRVATTDASGRVRVWDGRDARLEHVVETRSPTRLAAVLSPDGSRLACVDGSRGILVRNLAIGTEYRFDAHDGEVTTLRFSPDGARLATGGSDRTICAWDVREDAPVGGVAPTLLWRSQPFETHIRGLKNVFDLAFSPDGRFVAAAEQGTRVEVFDESGRRVARTPVIATPGLVVFSPDQSLILVGSKYGRGTTLWSFPARGPFGELVAVGGIGPARDHHTNSLTALATARDAQFAVSGSLDGTARLWDLPTRSAIASYFGHSDAVFDADIDPSGTWIVTAAADGTARLWPRDLEAAARKARPDGFTTVVGPLPNPTRNE